jgi:hypothetical protein
MRKKRLIVWGTLAIVLASVFTFTRCNDSISHPQDPGPTTFTFTLEKFGSNAFTLTVSGADWDRDGGFTNFDAENAAGAMLIFGGLSVAGNPSVQNDFFDYTISEKTIIAILKTDYSFLSGTLIFRELNGNPFPGSVYTNAPISYSYGNDMGGGVGYNIFVGKPEAGITFW